MSNTAATQAVCAACRHNLGCIYETSAHRAILECAQFELALRAAPADSTFDATRTAAGENGWSRLEGLCSNCDLRDACIYPKPEGGVWRCEEYR